LWPLPSHVLRAVYDRHDMQAFENHPYWTTEYFHIGPYRPLGIDPVDIVFVPVDNFFLGQPKIDRVILRQFGSADTLYAAVLSKSVHMTFDESVEAVNAYELKRHWEATGEGRVLLNTGGIRRIVPQVGPEL